MTFLRTFAIETLIGALTRLVPAEDENTIRAMLILTAARIKDHPSQPT